MRALLLRRLTAALIGLAVATGVLTLAPIPARAASFGVTMTVSSGSIRQGEKVTITGKVSPRPSSRYVYLQQRDVDSSSWRTVKKVKTSKTGAFRVAVPAGTAIDRHYRIYKPKQGKRKAGYSRSVQVIVDPILVRVASPTLTAVSPATGPLAGGQQVTITGTGLSGTTRVTFTPLVPPAYTKDDTGILPELEAAVSPVDDNSLVVTTPASLGGAHLVKVYTPDTTLTADYSYVATSRQATSFELQLLTEINARRTTTQTCDGASMPAVGALRWDGEFADLALAHARDLAVRQDVYQGLSHETYRLDSFGRRFQAAGFGAPYGEILALTSAAGPAVEVVNLWMTSPGHCRAIMNRSWTAAGIGVAEGDWLTSFGPQHSRFSNVDFR